MAWRKLEDGSMIDTVDVRDYFRAIHQAPPGTMIKMGELEKSPEWAQCTECGALMDWVLTKYHVHEAKS